MRDIFCILLSLQSHQIRCNNITKYLLCELSHYMFKMSIAGYHTCLKSLAVVFRSVVNGVFLGKQTKSTIVHL